MYRSLSYISGKQCVRLFTWNKKGERVHVDVPFKPYLYVESLKGEDVSIYNTKLKKVSFETYFDKTQHIKRYDKTKLSRVFENFSAQQQFLIDSFWKENETSEFTQYPLRVQFLDIEVYCTKGFPHADQADHPVNVITVYDSFDKKFKTWGLEKEYKSKQDNVDYTKCETEEELLMAFISYIEETRPDILSGWNCEFFDIPYIINRGDKIIGRENMARLSPLYPDDIADRHALRPVEKHVKNSKKKLTKWYIEGLSCIDYLDIYRRFCPKMRENYKLNTIGQIELGAKKVDIEGSSLANLADTNWEKFIDYNIQDVNLLIQLEEKLQYITLLRMLAYCGLTSFEMAMGTISIVNGAAAIKARFKGKKIATFIRPEKNRNNNEEEELSHKNPGAYVADPEKGFQRSVVSVDANSLYPNVMITCNMSPETKVGKIGEVIYDPVNLNHTVQRYTHEGKLTAEKITNYHIKFVNQKTVNLTPAEFVKFIQKNNLSITKAGVLFHQNSKGIMPEIVDEYYKKRKVIQAELSELKHKISQTEKTHTDYRKIKDTIDRLNASQLCIKVFINSVYGYFGNKHAPMGDDDIAASITLTGQGAIKHSNILIRNYIQQKLGVSDEEFKKMKNPVIYNDTDSYTAETKIVTNHGIFQADELYDTYINNLNNISYKGHEIQPVSNLKTLTFDSKNKKVRWGNIKNLVRHKVSKKKYKIKADGKEITMTEDHGCMVYRDGVLIRVRPEEIIKGDRMVIYNDIKL